MKAFKVRTESGVTVLEAVEIDIPKVGRGEIKLRVHAAGLNRGEFIVGGVMHGGTDKPGGTEAAGEVVEIGQDVSGIAIGERIMGRVFGTQGGAFAEFAVMQVHQAMPIPDQFSFEEAAATPSSFMAAYDAVLSGGKLAKGDSMLVTAASSAVGVASIQIAHAIGAQTVGTTGSPNKIERLEAIGLNTGIVTLTPNFSAKVRKIYPGGMALAINCAGGSYFNECLACLSHSGRLAIVGYLDGIRSCEVDLRELHANCHVVFGISNGRRSPTQHEETVVGFKRDVLPLMQSGALKPFIDQVFPFADLPAAKQHMESNNQVGKIVVRMD